MTAPTLSPADLDALFDQPVVVTPIREPVAPTGGALVFWDDGANEGVIVQPLYSDRDREYMRQQMLGIIKMQVTHKPKKG